MFKEENRMWLYLLGILIMFGILAVFTLNYLIPIIFGQKKFDLPVKQDPPKFILEADVNYSADIQTNLGTITVDLFEKNAPINVNNFVTLANKEFYNGLSFYRLVPGLLIQGGDPNTLEGDPEEYGKGTAGYVVPDEINLTTLDLEENEIEDRLEEGYESNPEVITPQFRQYFVAMANDGPDTNSSQFFIILANSNDSRLDELDGRFTPIGIVTNGFETVNIIRNIPVNNPELIKPSPIQEILIEQIIISPSV